MNKLHFGPAGIPNSTPGKATLLDGINHIPKLGLDAMEIEFVRNVYIKEEKTELVKETAKKNNVLLTAHGQYYVNLNAKNPATLSASIKSVLHASDIAWKSGAWSICFHMAHSMGDNEETIYNNVKKQVKGIVNVLKNSGNYIWLRPETGGKISQFADIDWLLKLSREVEQVLPCIDWAHHYARSVGKVNNYDSFKNILLKIENGLGREALDNMHMHIEGIEFNQLGEKKHLNLDESNLNYRDIVKVWKEFKVKGIAISESPNLEEDALKVKKVFENPHHNKLYK